MDIEGKKITENIHLCPDGKYRWVYEFPMLKNPAILITIFKLFGLMLLIAAAFVFLINIIDGSPSPMASGEGRILLFVVLLFAGLVLLSYLILAAVYGWKYIVLFEMDEVQVVHLQMPKQFEKAQAMGWLASMAGIAVGSYPVAGVGALSAAKTSSTSLFVNVKEVIGQRNLHLIKVNQGLDHNQVYADPEDYEFVWNFITQHCIHARIR